MRIPFYSPFHGKNEQNYIADCLKASLATDGDFSRRTLEALKQQLSSEYLLLVPTCSAALELSIAMLPLKPRDEVLLPSYNFPSAANAILQRGLKPVFCDVDENTQNITVEEAEKKLTSRTRVLLTVDYAGISCSYDALKAFARRHDLFLVEDAAQGLGSYYKNEPLGTQGDFSAISFHHTKNISCGEGGLFLCRDAELFEKACVYRMHGTNRQAFLNGLCDRYTWRQSGTSLPLNELSCALLLSQLEEIEAITSNRRERLFFYLSCLKPLEEKGLAVQMKIPDTCTPNGHLYYLRFSTPELKEEIRLLLGKNGIDSRTHYVPLHASPMGQRLGYRPEDLPKSMRTYQTLLRLPLHTSLTPVQQEEICDILLKWGKKR